MQRRIYGLEHEYGIICTPDQPGKKSPSIQNVVMYLFREIISGRMDPDVFLENGARFYQKPHYRPEYATPECDNVIDLVTHAKAGERIVERLSIAAERRMRTDGLLGKISAFKNNTDTRYNTWECHENYLMDGCVSSRQLAAQLIPFLVTRQIFTGSGKVKSTHRGGYAISQRAKHILKAISIGTTTGRSIINIRGEPHVNPEKYKRLHIIFGDSNMSEFTTFLKIGTTSIVLRMIEDNFIGQRLVLSDSVRALQQISEDTSCTRRIELEDGRRLSAIEIQREYLDCANQYLEREESDPITDQIIDRWEYVLNCLEEDPMSLSREIDWIIKKKLIDNYVMRRCLEWDSDVVLLLDLQYHNIRSDLGLYYKLEREGLVERITTDAAIEEAMIHPPETTRAKFRGRFVKLVLGGKITCGVNWSYIQLYEPYQKLYISTDPLTVEYEEGNTMTPEQKIEYEAQGYLVITDAFEQKELERIRNAFDQAGADDGLDDLPNRDDIFIHLAENPNTFPSVHRIIGNNVQLRSVQGMQIAPSRAGRGWHREVGCLIGVHHPASTVCVQVLFHLEDVTEESACIAVVPGSHRFKLELPFPDITYIEEMPHHVPLRVKAGTAIVLHGNIWQARMRNRSDTSQRLLEYTYTHCWMRQALPDLSPHTTAVVSSTHNLSQLFGIRTTDRNASWYWGRKIEGYPSSTGLPERRFSELSVVGKGVPNVKR